MLERVKYFWEKFSLIIVLLIFILFEIRITIVVPEVVIEILFAIANFYLLLLLMKNIKEFYRIKWQQKRYH